MTWRESLQDMHWAGDYIGYFQSYALGNIYDGQILAVLARDVPDCYERVGQGNFAPVLDWLRDHIWQYGIVYTGSELMTRLPEKPGRPAFPGLSEPEIRRPVWLLRCPMKKLTKGDQTKEHLYHCALALFRDKGYDGVTVDAIVQRAHVAKGTFYIYFKSKSDIITELLKSYDSYYLALKISRRPSMGVEEKFDAIITGSCRFTQEEIGRECIQGAV